MTNHRINFTPVLAVFMFVFFISSHIISGQKTSEAKGLTKSNGFRAGAASSYITPFLGGGLVGAWSPSGRMIGFNSTHTGSRHVYIFRLSL